MARINRNRRNNNNNNKSPSTGNVIPKTLSSDFQSFNDNNNNIYPLIAVV